MKAVSAVIIEENLSSEDRFDTSSVDTASSVDVTVISSSIDSAYALQ